MRIICLSHSGKIMILEDPRTYLVSGAAKADANTERRRTALIVKYGL